MAEPSCVWFAGSWSFDISCLLHGMPKPSKGGVEGAGDVTGEEAAVDGSEDEISEESQNAVGRRRAAGAGKTAGTSKPSSVPERLLVRAIVNTFGLRAHGIQQSESLRYTSARLPSRMSASPSASLITS